MPPESMITADLPIVSIGEIGEGLPIDALKDASLLTLLHFPVSIEAQSLVNEVTAMVATQEVRKRPRGTGGNLKLSQALGAVLGGVLSASLGWDGLVYRPLKKDAFTGLPVGHRNATTALDGLANIGLLKVYSGHRFEAIAPFEDNASWTGKAGRYGATEELLKLADNHGITKGSVGSAFSLRFPHEPPKVKAPITLRSIPNAAPGRRKVDNSVDIAVNASDPAVAALLADIHHGNEVLAAHNFDQCLQPRLYRAFRESYDLGGRWITAGEYPVQQMNPAARLSITIDGGPVAEIDVKASHLSILAAFAGIPEISGDPYAIPGPWDALPNSRPIIKAVVVRILGSGKLLTRWPSGLRQKLNIPNDLSIKDISSALASKYPFLHNPGKVLGVEPDRVALKLQCLEAGAIGAVLSHMWNLGVPAVPVHDSIIVPERFAPMVAGDLPLAYHARLKGAVIQTEIKMAG